MFPSGPYIKCILGNALDLALGNSQQKKNKMLPEGSFKTMLSRYECEGDVQELHTVFLSNSA